VKRFPAVVLGALIAATVAAFFVIQHLKVTTPFLAGEPNPAPGWIDPYGAFCNGKSHRTTHMSFYLLHQAGDVDMYVVDANGNIVDQVASNRYMPKLTATNSKTVRRTFYWNGRESNGSVAPDGIYHFEVTLIQQDRTIDVGGPIHVLTTPPHPVVYRVSPQLIPAGGTPVRIRFRGNDRFRSLVLIYRTDVPGRPQLAYEFETRRHPRSATWNGLINGSPAPAGTYLIGLATTDLACNVGRFPVVLPPPPGTTPHAGVTVRYLAAQPPLDPVAAGARAPVYVDSRGRPYSWRLFLAGAPKVLARGTGAPPGSPLQVRLPKSGPGLYELSITSGPHKTIVPLVASAPSSASRPRILVVLPALTWQGLNPVDDVGPSPYDGDGLPNTLAAGVPIQTERVLADGLPAGIGDQIGLLSYLRKAHLPYDLTTDLGLVDGVGPVLNAYRGIVLAGTERWLPQSLGAGLRTYVEQGGNVLSLGIDSLRRAVTVKLGQASHPTPPAAFDVLGARPGPLVAGSSALITVIHDGLGIFTGTSGAFPGYSSFQPFTAVQVPQGPSSLAGTTPTSASIIGYRLGHGIVVDVGLVGFGSSLEHNVNSQQFVGRLWQVLAR
jgi:hypothetical protein